MTANLPLRLVAPLIAAVLAIGGCQDRDSGPVRIVAIGAAPVLVDPNREQPSPATAMLLEATAQGLVRFDASGEIEPALAQSWIVSDDGMRYTFRLRRTLWARGERVTARKVVERLRATLARESRNPFKPVLGAIEQIEAMTEQVLEIRLRSPRANFLQLLAQPEMAILADQEGTGPYRIAEEVGGALRLVPPAPDDEGDIPAAETPDLLLRGEPAADAIARFVLEEADLVVGGTIGNLPLLARADIPDDRIVFDPVRGLLGLSFVHNRGLLADPEFRRALSMSLDRPAMMARLGAPGAQPRNSILPPGLAEAPRPAVPGWTANPLAVRREVAGRTIAGLIDVERPRVRVAVPEGPGYLILFAHIRRDWSIIGVEAVAVRWGAAADLRLVDQVAPADLAPWFLRPFLCSASAICDISADLVLEAARSARAAPDRLRFIADADRTLNEAAAFIPIGNPVRWSLRSPRLNALRPNLLGRHTPSELVEGDRM